MALFATLELVNEAAAPAMARYRLAIACPSAVMHCGLITLLVIVQPAGTGAVVGLLIFVVPKLPESMAVEGRLARCGVSKRRISFCSSPTKKKSLLRRM